MALLASVSARLVGHCDELGGGAFAAVADYSDSLFKGRMTSIPSTIPDKSASFAFTILVLIPALTKSASHA